MILFNCTNQAYTVDSRYNPDLIYELKNFVWLKSYKFIPGIIYAPKNFQGYIIMGVYCTTNKFPVLKRYQNLIEFAL